MMEFFVQNTGRRRGGMMMNRQQVMKYDDELQKKGYKVVRVNTVKTRV